MRHIAIASMVALAGVSAASGAVFSENFDSLLNTGPIIPAGWTQVNNSVPIGTVGWFPTTGFSTPPAPQAGANAIAANFQAGAGLATLSNWLITPVNTWNNGDTVSFWTRSLNTPAANFPDRLQVRLSTNGGSNPGTGAFSTGDFTTLLLDINPTYALTGPSSYPTAYTQFTATVSGIVDGSTGSLAFRYFVENGGPAGDNSNAIIIDTLDVVPAPSAMALLGLGGLAAARRRRN